MRTFKTVAYAAIMAFAGMTAAAPAMADTLDFTGNICGAAGNQACGDGSQIGQNYGDRAGVDVSYRSALNTTGVTAEPFLKFWNGNYGDLQGVVWGGSEATATYSEITFTALAGFEVALTGFDAACYLNRASCQSFPFSVSEIGGGVVASGTNTPPSGQHVTQSLELGYSTTGYVLRWGPDGYDGGLDNITFDVRAVTSAVPEPASWAMLMTGFGLVGGSLRRRRGARGAGRLTLA